MIATKSTGFVLGIAGAFLDFSAGYLLLTQSMTTTNDMGVTNVEYNASTISWGVGIIALGAVLLITALVSVSTIGIKRMRFMGVIMVIYGATMLFIGASMYSRIASMMEGSLALSFGMFLVGGLMVLNGIVMQKAPWMLMTN